MFVFCFCGLVSKFVFSYFPRVRSFLAFLAAQVSVVMQSPPKPHSCPWGRDVTTVDSTHPARDSTHRTRDSPISPDPPWPWPQHRTTPCVSAGSRLCLCGIQAVPVRDPGCAPSAVSQGTALQQASGPRAERDKQAPSVGGHFSVLNDSEKEAEFN